MDAESWRRVASGRKRVAKGCQQVEAAGGSKDVEAKQQVEANPTPIQPKHNPTQPHSWITLEPLVNPKLPPGCPPGLLQDFVRQPDPNGPLFFEGRYHVFYQSAASSQMQEHRQPIPAACGWLSTGLTDWL